MIVLVRNIGPGFPLRLFVMSQIPLIGPPLEIRFSVKTWEAYIFTSECVKTAF